MVELGRFPAIEFHQFNDGEDDRLVMFAAPASTLAQWAGVPRKGWRLRALYQRWITPGREQEVKQFWEDAASYNKSGHRFLLGPTALTLAATQDLHLQDGHITLEYDNPALAIKDDAERLGFVADRALRGLETRLSPSELESLQSVPPPAQSVEYESNHVLESAIQIAQMAQSPEDFIFAHRIPEDEVRELIQALEALCRPALVVDGQHRLVGAAKSNHPVNLPVVLLPHASWVDQVFQFVLINEAARKVDTSLLTDIFGNSLTPVEQIEVRDRLKASKIDVEARIAAVVADQHPNSPFKGLVRINLGEPIPPSEEKGFLTESTIRQLIDGGRGTDGFRRSDEFYEYVVRPILPDREAWESWQEGAWRLYWYAFWRAVRDYYNAEVIKTDFPGLLWAGEQQTNLTKAVTLRLFQQMFMDKAVERSKATEILRPVLQTRFEPEELENILVEEKQKVALAPTPEQFEADVRDWFLAKGVPVRVFTRQWVRSLDDNQGMAVLKEELERAWDTINRGDRYVARNKFVFEISDES
jgi:hypothetical protein